MMDREVGREAVLPNRTSLKDMIIEVDPKFKVLQVSFTKDLADYLDVRGLFTVT